jgi:hypothetical protein
MHFVFRSWVSGASNNAKTAALIEDPSWADPYYVPGSWRARQRQTFAGTL